MEALLKKFYNALNPGGVLLIISEGIAPDFSGTVGYGDRLSALLFKRYGYGE